jgi:ATP-dependent DNA ligase
MSARKKPCKIVAKVCRRNLTFASDFCDKNSTAILKSESVIRVSQEVEADGATLLAAARERGLEGIIAKHRDSIYRSGRLGDWLKIKCIQTPCLDRWREIAACFV